MPDLVNQLCHQFTAVATQLEQGWQYDLYNAQQELNRERQISEELMHKVISLEEECHGHQMSGIELQQEQEKNGELEKKLQETKTYWNNAEHMVKDAGGVIDELRAKLTSERGEATHVPTVEDHVGCSHDLHDHVR